MAPCAPFLTLYAKIITIDLPLPDVNLKIDHSFMDLNLIIAGTGHRLGFKNPSPKVVMVEHLWLKRLIAKVLIF